MGLMKKIIDKIKILYSGSLNSIYLRISFLKLKK